MRAEVEPMEERALNRARLALPRAVTEGRRQIVEIVAPAGYGKSTLVESWSRALAADGRQVYRLPLTQSHRDPVRFLANLLQAIEGRDPGATGAGAPVFSEDAGLEQLIATLQSDSAPIAVVIDDVHLLESSPAIDTLNWICRNQPDHVLLILSAREYTGLALQKRLLAKQVTRYSARELAFTVDEAGHFLEQMYGLRLDAETLVRLHAQTEGWIAALQMAALAMGHRTDPTDFVRHFGGSNREITDYLAEAVLDNLSEDDVQFLFRISVLDRVNADVCRALTGEKAPQLRLESIERQNLFLLPMDDRRDWYRFHPLFGEFLRGRFRAADPDGWADCLKRAESWSIQHDYRDDAINYALRAGLQERAAQILSMYAEELVQWRGEHRTLMNWIDQLSPRVLARYPQIQISLAWSLNFNHRFAEAEAVLDALLAEIQADDMADSATLLKSVGSYRDVVEIVGHALADHAEQTLDCGRRWMQCNPNAPDFLHASAGAAMGYALKSVGQFDEALEVARDAKLRFTRARAPYGKVWAEAVSLMTLMRQGRLQHALAEAESALTVCREKLGPASHGYCVLSALSAGLYYEFNNLPAAREALSQGLRFLAMFSSLDPVLVGYLTLAKLLVAEDRYDDAKDILIEGENLGVQRSAPRMVVCSLVGRALICLKQGDIATAEELARSPLLNGAIHDERYSGLVRDKSAQLQARIAVARGHADAALEILQPLIRHARAQGQQLKLVDLLLQRAHALYLLGNQNEALRALHEAIGIAAPEGMIRVFVDEGESLHPLLRSLCEREAGPSDAEARITAHLQAILSACQLTPNAGAASSAPGRQDQSGAMLEPLTKRELQILRMIESGMSNRQLAQALFVSEGTVKWHLHNLYSKLSVRSRSGAIAKARRLTLIS
ncbi:tetratricopeptide repeat protein [Sinimarinibacterium sp. CAU 1509]|uniref:LuxR C-terminal-related transcriptional regulator n=1 Tax=Sinimarinibacterium sp. CAU 1509 TaxID=2562283 RepID=UPI0010ACC108|nr:LuxR C-terminal-related transcriptional regulator [Sinimarinibacterium sp. CAU 1509]TJY64798.1 tetratricopeptide repeat protein [Sinimarinibacterium sp. CAU 1509]